MSIAAADYPAMAAWLRQHQRLLLATHCRPDGDAVGSLLATWHVLNAGGWECICWVDKPLPSAYADLAPPALRVGTAVAPGEFAALLCLDAAAPSRVCLPNDWQVESIGVPTASIDHHLDNHRYADLNLVDSDAAATCSLLHDFFIAEGFGIDRTARELLLIGLITDTGGFRFSNTTPRALRHAATMIEEGVDYQPLVQRLYYNTPFGLLRLQARVVQEMQFALDGRLAWFRVTPEMLRDCGVRSADTEDLIDVAREIAGVEICCRLQQVEGAIRFSLRSSDPAHPALALARRLGGGGHAMAAGATLENGDFETAEKLLLRYTKELLDG